MPDAPAQDALPLETPPHPEPSVAPASAAALEDLRARLRATRWPDAPEDAGWSLGTDVDYLRELVAYWADEFDWPAQEAALARLPGFRVALGDLRRSARFSTGPQPGARPRAPTPPCTAPSRRRPRSA
jgi:epoxide hydrolase-like protein